jgi:hypothetical protein
MQAALGRGRAGWPHAEIPDNLGAGGRCDCHGSKGDVRVDTRELAAVLARGQIQCQQRLQILLQIVAADCATAQMARPEINVRRSSRGGVLTVEQDVSCDIIGCLFLSRCRRFRPPYAVM